MRTVHLVISALLAMAMQAQPTVPNPDDILIGDRPQPHVMLLGTFHFDYPGLDAHVTDTAKQVDVMDAKRQRELDELLEVILRFKPTKICLEAQGDRLWHEYQEHKAGKALGRNEYYQLGFKIMDRAGLDTLYAVDAQPLVVDLRYGSDSARHIPWIDPLFEGWDWGGPDEISPRYDALYAAQDTYRASHTLLEGFLAMNDDHAVDRGLGAYLNGGFLLRVQDGADILSIHWYSRNLRIFRNIKRITTTPDDRILVIFGAGHMGILKHLFQCDPMYGVVTLQQLVERGR